MNNTNNSNDKYLSLAEKLEEEGDFLTSERNFLMAIIKNSELIEATDFADPNKISYINDESNYRAKLGAFYLRYQSYEKAETFLLGAANIKEKLLDINDSPIIKRELALIYSDLGDLYDYQERLEDSIKYYILASSIFDKLIDMFNRVDDKDELSSIYISLAMINKKLSNISSAEKYFLKSIDLKEEILDELNEDEYKSRLAITYIGLANLYMSNNNHKSAERFLYKAIDLLSKIDKIYENYVYGDSLATCYLNFANLYDDIDLIDKYLNYALEVKSILLKQFNFKEDVNDIIDIYEMLSNVYKNNGNPIKSLSYRKKANKFRKMIS